MKRTIKSGLLLAVIAGLLTGCGGGGGGSSAPSKPTPSSTLVISSSSSSSVVSSSLSSSSSSVAVDPIAVKSTSHLNKNVDFTFSVYDLFDGWNSIARKKGLLRATESVGSHATGYADFQQNGSYSLIVNTSFLLQYDSAGVPFNGKILAVDLAGNDITKDLIEGDTTGCIHPRKALVADFNGDSFPDVFFSCSGDDIPSVPGETSLIVLSTGPAKYKVAHVKGTEFGYSHGATAADVDGDGYVDLIIADPKFNNHTQSLRILMGDGAGNFIDDSQRMNFDKVIGRSASHANYYSVEAIEIDSVLYILAGGNEIDSDGFIDGDEVPTFAAPFKEGFVDDESVIILPPVDNTIPLDFVKDSHNNLFVLRTSDEYVGIIAQQVNPQNVPSILINRTDTLSIKHPSSWIAFFEIVDDTLFSVNSDVSFIF